MGLKAVAHGLGSFPLPPLPFSRDLLKQFTTMELMRWAALVEDYGKELREGSPDSPATDVFDCTEDGEKRWKDLKNRVVEHVSYTLERMLPWYSLMLIGESITGLTLFL